MKHLTIIDQRTDEHIEPYIASISGNSFGDQLIDFRLYGLTSIDDDGRQWYGYTTIGHAREIEGSHLSHNEIIEVGLKLLKQLSIEV